MRKIYLILLGLICFISNYQDIKAENFKPYLIYKMIPMEVQKYIPKNLKYLVFTAAIDEDKTKEELEIGGKCKIVSIYLKNEKLYYVYGEEGRTEIQIKGIPGKNLFKNYSTGHITDFGERVRYECIIFKNKNYTYILTRNSVPESKLQNDYNLKIYKDGEEEEILRLVPVADDLFENSIISEIPSIEDITYTHFNLQKNKN